MKIYIDVILFLNFTFDLLLLLTTALVQKKKLKWKNIILGSFVGSGSILFLFIEMNSFTLFIFKIILSIFIILITFGFNDIKTFGQNLAIFYFVSIILGGFLYFLNIQFSYSNSGLVFFHEGLSINVIFLLIISPLILYYYLKQTNKLKFQRSTYYTVDVYLTETEKITLQGYLDTGNKLYDPYKHRPVLLIYSDLIDIPFEGCVPVPYEALNYKGVLRCRKVHKIIIDGVCEHSKILIAKSSESFRLPGVGILLHPDLF